MTENPQPTPSTSQAPPSQGRKRELTPAMAAVISAAITAATMLYINREKAPTVESASIEKNGNELPAIESVNIDGALVELLGCEPEGPARVDCQLKVTSLIANHGLTLRKNSIVLADRSGHNFQPASLIVDGKSADEWLFPAKTNLPLNVLVTFSNVGTKMEDYELLRIDFGVDQSANFKLPGQFPYSSKR